VFLRLNILKYSLGHYKSVKLRISIYAWILNSYRVTSSGGRDERRMGDRQRFRRRLSARSTRRSHEEFSRRTARPRRAKATDPTKHAEHHARDTDETYRKRQHPTEHLIPQKHVRTSTGRGRKTNPLR
jgi:hypothetical protein